MVTGWNGRLYDQVIGKRPPARPQREEKKERENDNESKKEEAIWWRTREKRHVPRYLILDPDTRRQVLVFLKITVPYLVRRFSVIATIDNYIVPSLCSTTLYLIEGQP